MPLPPLILIHGYPLDHTMWKPVVSILGEKTKVIVPDLPGFGDNPVALAEPSIDAMAEDVAKLFEFHNIRRAVVAGMSLGGYVALAFAQRHPERLAGLALISSQAGADSNEAKEARRNLIAKVRREGVQPAVEALQPKLFSSGKESNPTFSRYLTDGASKAGVEGICWALEAMAQRPDRTSLLKTLSVPVLILHGTDDKIIPAERARQLAQTVPQENFVELPGVGHASPLESPQAVADALLALLERAEKSIHHTPKRDEHAEGLPGITWAPSERGL